MHDSGGDVAAVSAAGGLGVPCGEAAGCQSGFCVDGVCCDTACGGGAGDDCQACAVAAGGELVSDKFSVGEFGFVAHVRDTETNKIGLHSAR